jgi:hypothetical protein
VPQSTSAALQELDARLADEVKPELDRVADDMRFAEEIRDDLVRLWAVCALMRSSIRNPKGTSDCYRPDVSMLKAAHRHISDRLGDALILPGF